MKKMPKKVPVPANFREVTIFVRSSAVFYSNQGGMRLGLSLMREGKETFRDAL